MPKDRRRSERKVMPPQDRRFKYDLFGGFKRTYGGDRRKTSKDDRKRKGGKKYSRRRR
jgi:hypothetical protein